MKRLTTIIGLLCLCAVTGLSQKSWEQNAKDLNGEFVTVKTGTGEEVKGYVQKTDSKSLAVSQEGRESRVFQREEVARISTKSKREGLAYGLAGGALVGIVVGGVVGYYNNSSRYGWASFLGTTAGFAALGHTAGVSRTKYRADAKMKTRALAAPYPAYKVTHPAETQGSLADRTVDDASHESLPSYLAR